MKMFINSIFAVLSSLVCAVAPVFSNGVAKSFEDDVQKNPIGRSLPGSGVCKGNRLLTSQRLYRNEFICDSSESYRFGLDENGVLADRYGPAIPSLEGKIIWSPTKDAGRFVTMQKDGNVALYDANNKKVWASHCFGDGAILMRSGSTWPNLYTVRPDRIPTGAFAPPEDQIWRVNYDQTSTTCTPPVYCRDNKLVAGQRLKRDEYICPYGLDGNELLTNSYRFGMNNHKRLVLAAQDDVIWSAEKGDFLNMQTDGNAVVYKDGKALWSTGCRKHGNFLQLESQGVFMRIMGDEGHRWFVGFDGTESESCENVYIPTDPCRRVGLSSGVCRIRMIDHLNVNYVELESKDIGDGKFTITDNVLGKCGRDPWTEKAELDGENIIIDAGVPDVTCIEMLEEYDVPLNDTQLDFLSMNEYPCTEFGQNLIWFMINEWFYFG